MLMLERALKSKDDVGNMHKASIGVAGIFSGRIAENDGLARRR